MKKDISPIFITGSVRSGTSIVNEALIKGANIPGFNEGCFIDIFGLFLRLLDTRIKSREKQILFDEIMLKDVNFDDFKKSFANWFFSEYLKYSKYDGVFVDKTPTIEVVSTAKDILKYLPNSKFIFMKRRSIENIESRLRKFTNSSFERQCVAWADIMDEIYKMKEKLPESNFIIIDQYDIAKEPEKVAQKIGVFLNLDFNKIEGVKNVFIKSRPEFTGGSEEKIKSLEDTNWSEDEKKIFIDCCKETNNKWGWSLDNKYYL